MRYKAKVMEVLDGLWAFSVWKGEVFKFRSDKNYRTRREAQDAGRRQTHYLNKRFGK